MSNEQQQAEPNTFDFGLESETAGYFGSNETQPTESVNPVVTGIKRTVDFGSGPVEIEAATEDEFLKTALERQREYDREQQLFGQQEADFDIPMPSRYEPIPDMTEDDLTALTLLAQKDPVGFLTEGMQKVLGMPIERFWEIDEQLSRMERMAYGDAISARFVNKHLKLDEYGDVVGGDYYPHPDNLKKMVQYMDNQGLDFTYENLEKSFKDIKQYLKPIPSHLLASEDEAVKTAPTALSSDIGSAVGQKAENTEAEIEEMFRKMTPQQLEAFASARRRY